MDGAWCSTEVDDDGFHIIGRFGYCGPECPILLPGKLKSMCILMLKKQEILLHLFF